MRHHFLFIVLLFCSVCSKAQDKPKWDVSNPPGKYKEVNFNTNEGTWMNLDISPDGKTIVFDLLGDIYTMPATGGTAKPLREGLAWEVQPRFNQKGDKILFTSDAGGGDNIWIMGSDGQKANQITKEDFRLLNNPCWVPGTEYFVARKHFTSTRSLGAGEIWMYHTSGGSGIQLTKRKNDQQDVNEPSVSKDGKYVYYSEDMYDGGAFQYNKDPNNQIYVIKRYNVETGETETIIGGSGSAFRPQISNNGEKLAFVRRIRTKTALCIFDLKTGEEIILTDNLSKDQQEAWAIFGVYTGYNWSPDDKEIIIWANGKINRINVGTKAINEIPFNVEVHQKIAETLRWENPVSGDSTEIKVLRQLVTSPDGNYCIFNALGNIWKYDFKNRRALRLTNSIDFEFEPSFSPDGKSLIYTTWNDEKMGSIMLLDLAANKSTILTTEKGIYRTPRFSPDGKRITFRKEDGNTNQGYVNTLKSGIYTMDLNTKKTEFVYAQGENPQFDREAKRIFFQTGGYLFGSLSKALKSVKLDGKDERTYFNTTYSNSFVLSPDNNWVAFIELHKVYVAAMPKSGQAMGISGDTKAFPLALVSKDAGINLHWSSDSKKLMWTLGNEYFVTPLEKRFKFLEGSPDTLPPLDSVGIKIVLKSAFDKPTGIIAFKNARIITMEGDQVMENATLIVDKDKISKIGSSAITAIPSNAYVVDCSGKTIMPGFIDVHAHLGAFRYGLSAQKHWQYYANLAYGVTTTHDPSSNSEMTFAQAEMVKTGKMVGPRIFSTGTILYGADGDFKAVINSLDDAKSALRRTAAFGAFSVKSYNQPRRDQRQQVIEAARQLKMLVVPEGGSFFYHNMNQMVDGHSSIEHNIPVAPVYKDVIKLWSSSKTSNTPTLIVNYGSMNGENYWYQKTNVWEKEKLLSFTPRAIIDSRSRHRTMIPDEEYENGHILTSKSCKMLQDAGVNINLGSHGQLQGLGAHWEIWMFAQGGMSNLQALRCATMNGAVHLGMDNEIGSLKTGKLADLIIMDKNPLDNIQNTETIIYTMINGRLYDTRTMDEIGNNNRKRTKFYWEQEGSGNYYPLDSETNSFMPTNCICGKGNCK